MTIPQETRKYATETKRIAFSFSFVDVCGGITEITGTLPRQFRVRLGEIFRELIYAEKSNDWDGKESKS